MPHDDEDDDDRPRKRKHRGDDDDDDYDHDRQGRKKSGGGATVAIIIVVVVVVVLGCGGLIAVGLLLPAVQKVREAASRAQEKNLMQIGLGMHQSSGVNNGKLPPAEGNLSWRVHLLPYIEQDGVYKQFDPKQAWDAGRNRPLADTVIKTYASPLDEGVLTQTHYRVFTGTGTAYDPELMRKRPFPEYITDGTSNTLLAADTTESIPWPQPKEIPFQPNGSFPELGHAKRPMALALLCDASVRSFDKKKMDPALLRALITATGGEVVPDW